jgi:hypothetical protein
MSEVANNPVSQEDIEKMIVECQQYRDRVEQNIREMGKKIKLPKKKIEENIIENEEIAKMDQVIQQLRSQLKSD